MQKLNIKIEDELTQTLKQICLNAGLHLAEWDLDQKLFIALKTSNRLTEASGYCKKYDTLMAQARKDCINFKPAFAWFENLIKE